MKGQKGTASPFNYERARLDDQSMEVSLPPQEGVNTGTRYSLGENRHETRQIIESSDEENEHMAIYSHKSKPRPILKPKTGVSLKTFAQSVVYARTHDDDNVSVQTIKLGSDTQDNRLNNQDWKQQPGSIMVKREPTSSEVSISGSGNFHSSYYEPQGPGDSWSCPYEGCNTEVWAARTPDSISLINDHFTKSHAGTAEELILSQCRPWLSVDHLLNRVRGITSFGANDTLGLMDMPSPVIRRY